MDYKKKYFKYKNKYIEKKNIEINQHGSGKNSHTVLDSRVLENISTGEEPTDRKLRENKGIPPEDGYRIMENTNEILEYNCNIESLRKNGREDLINKKKNNINDFFGILFDIFNSDFGIPLYLIDSRGDGKCFLNSLFIFTILSGKANKVNELYSYTGIRESNLVNFNDFKSGIYFLGDSLLDSKRSDYGDEFYKLYKEELHDENLPSVQILGQVYSNFFTCKILVLQIDSDYKFTGISAEISPEENDGRTTDHVVIIQQQNIHFNLLIPLTTDRDHRTFLYYILLEKFKNK